MRHSRTGELGWLVRRSGQQMVKRDLPNQDVIVKYISGDWIDEVPQRPLAKMQIIRIAFEADKELCRSLGGLQAHSRRSWEKMNEHEREVFAKHGPKAPPARVTLFAMITVGLEPFSK